MLNRKRTSAAAVSAPLKHPDETVQDIPHAQEIVSILLVGAKR